MLDHTLRGTKDRFLRPLAAALTPFSPNVITLLALVIGLTAAVLAARQTLRVFQNPKGLTSALRCRSAQRWVPLNARETLFSRCLGSRAESTIIFDPFSAFPTLVVTRSEGRGYTATMRLSAWAIIFASMLVQSQEQSPGLIS